MAVLVWAKLPLEEVVLVAGFEEERLGYRRQKRSLSLTGQVGVRHRESPCAQQASAANEFAELNGKEGEAAHARGASESGTETSEESALRNEGLPGP